ncbi:MAG: cysteine rich repeat-containing protein [Syntrophorhabdales bacterium]|jgi:hypothetical protein
MKSRRREIRLLALTVVAMCLVAVTGFAVFAQQSGPCMGDIERYCRGVEPGGGRIGECLVLHKEELTPGCKFHMAEVAEQIKEVHQACKDDVMWFCGGVQPGGGRIAQCLKANRERLSMGCKVKLFEAKQEMK